jgi:hypothetical protein
MEDLKGRVQLENLDVEEKILPELMLKEQG